VWIDNLDCIEMEKRKSIIVKRKTAHKGKRSWVKSSNGASVQTRVCRRKERLLKTCREVRRFLAQNQVRAYLSSIRQSSQRRKEKVVEVLSEATFPARSTAIIPI
jgi:hypothetical protein